MKKLLLLALVLLAGRLAVSAQTVWKLSAEKEGIKIYTAQVPDSKIKAIKVECDVQASEAQLVALLMDVNSSADWVYHTKTSTLIKQVSPSELYYYSEINLPWPAANRDFVGHLVVTQNPNTKVVEINGPAVPGLVPVKKGVVRIDHSEGKWTITPCGCDHLKVEYTLHVEPGGSVPSWMVNMFATDGPMQIFKKLKQQIQKSTYKNAVLPYIQG
jgi:hypothetical protein